jgi:hypothetical protein
MKCGMNKVRSIGSLQGNKHDTALEKCGGMHVDTEEWSRIGASAIKSWDLIRTSIESPPQLLKNTQIFTLK